MFNKQIVKLIIIRTYFTRLVLSIRMVKVIRFVQTAIIEDMQKKK